VITLDRERPTLSTFKDDSETPIGIRTGMMTLLPLLRCSHCAGDEPLRVLPAAPATGDASLQAGIEVTNPDTVKRTKTRKRKSEPGELSSPRQRIRRHFIS